MKPGNMLSSKSNTAPFSGTKAIPTVGDNPSAHSILRGLYYEALSPKAVVEMEPFIETCLAKRGNKWDQMAKSSGVTNNTTQIYNSIYMTYLEPTIMFARRTTNGVIIFSQFKFGMKKT